MARRSSSGAPDEYTLYDIDPRFQDSVMAWLAKKNVIVDIGVNPHGVSRFRVTFDPGGEIDSDSFELAIVDAMGKKARKRYIDPELEVRVHEFMVGQGGAHITIGATKSVFNVVVSGPDATGKASDEDLELALVFAEEDFWDNMPEHTLAPAERAELAGALLTPRAQRDEESQDQLRKALFEPRPELEANRSQSYAQWVGEVDEELTAIGGRFDDAAPSYWRQLYQAGFGPSEAVQEFGQTRFDTLQANDGMHPQRSVARWQRPFTYGRMPTPPSMRERRVEYPAPGAADDKPFDPAAPRERYARPHHFAVNAKIPLEWRKGPTWSQAQLPGMKYDVLPRSDGDGYEASVLQGGVPVRKLGAFPTLEQARASADLHYLQLNPSDTRAHHFAMNMDPNAALVRYWGAIENGDIRAAREAKSDLVDWIERGGFEPDWAASGHSRQEFFALTGRSMRSRHGSPHGHRDFAPMPGRRRFMVTTSEAGVILGSGLMSRQEANAVGDAKSAGEPYEVIEYVAGSDEDPRMRSNPAYSQISRRGTESGPGDWRIEVAGNDIDPQSFTSYEGAVAHAQAKYGRGGWTVAWHARGDEDEPVGRGSLMARHGYR